MLLKADFPDGRLFWRERPACLFKTARACSTWNTRFADRPAFTTVNSYGYLTGGIFGRLYKAHRVIFAMATGSWPDGGIDHAMGLRADNRLSAISPATPSENSRNRARPCNNTSGVVGVYRNKCSQKWVAEIKVNGRKIYLGSFTDKTDAVAARKAAEIEHGFHENHGRTPWPAALMGGAA